MWYLSQHPDVVVKLKREIMQVIGPTAVPGYDDIKKLKYVKRDFRQPAGTTLFKLMNSILTYLLSTFDRYQKQVVNEVLRLRPPVPFNTK